MVEEQIELFNEIKKYILENYSTHHESSRHEHFVTVTDENWHLKYYPDWDGDGEVLAYYETADKKRQEEIFLEEVKEGDDYSSELEEMFSKIK